MADDLENQIADAGGCCLQTFQLYETRSVRENFILLLTFLQRVKSNNSVTSVVRGPLTMETYFLRVACVLDFSV